MPVRSVNEKIKCDICGNEVVVTQVGGGTLFCCGQEMQHNGLHEIPVSGYSPHDFNQEVN